jgi:hypothetical protein
MIEGALDRRTYAYRDDLADANLEGKVDAPRFAAGERRQVVAGVTTLRREPRHDAPLDTELLFGEAVTVYDEREGWAWVQAEADRYVGYVSADALTTSISEPTHRVRALRTHLYPAPDIKSPPLELLSMNALVSVEKIDGRFAQLGDGRFATAAHLVRATEFAPDFVTVAEKFLGTPYLWGGRTSIGLDCSALVQLSLNAAGRSCPRDSDMQEALGEKLADPKNLDALERGDLLFWKGHVGMMLDGDRLLHCNAFHMATAIEPVAEAVERIEASESPVTSVRRLS